VKDKKMAAEQRSMGPDEAKKKFAQADKMFAFSSTTLSSQADDLTKALTSLAQRMGNSDEKTRFNAEMEGFRQLFNKYKEAKKNAPLEWDKIRPPPQNLVIPHRELPTVSQQRISELSKKLCVLKLNGGLGTTMGCTGPKSVIEVHSNLSFLDLTVSQIDDLNKTYNTDVPLVLMNSFNTHEDTLKVISKYSHISARILTFNQSRYPRILKETLLPMPTDL